MANSLEIIEKLSWANGIATIQKKINEILDYLNPSKILAFNITQSVGTIPTATSILNTTGLGTPTLARTSAGIYTITLAGAFTANKVTAFIQNNIDALNAYEIINTDANTITIKTYVLSVDTGVLIKTLTDGLLTATPVRITIQG